MIRIFYGQQNFEYEGNSPLCTALHSFVTDILLSKVYFQYKPISRILPNVQKLNVPYSFTDSTCYSLFIIPLVLPI